VLSQTFAPYAGQSAGLVIVYGQSTTPGEGEQLANGAYAALRSYLPEIFTDKTIVKPPARSVRQQPPDRIRRPVLRLAVRPAGVANRRCRLVTRSST
jgi:hypothetical protein